MVRSIYDGIDTPALLIDEEQMRRNLAEMQERADRLGVKLRLTQRPIKCQNWQSCSFPTELPGLPWRRSVKLRLWRIMGLRIYS